MYQYVPRKGILVKKIKKKRKEKGFNLEKTEQQYSMYTYLSKVRRSSFDFAYFFDFIYIPKCETKCGFKSYKYPLKPFQLPYLHNPQLLYSLSHVYKKKKKKKKTP